MSIPSLERLLADLGETYVLRGAGLSEVPVELCAVETRVPLSSRYRCYSALLALPPGMGLGPLSCTVSAGSDGWPHLLLTPVGTHEDGRQLLEMVFHCLASEPAAPSPALF